MSPIYLWTGIAVAVAAVLTWAAVALLRKAAPQLGLIDVPNDRSSHVRPTPRAGGLGFVIVSPIVTMSALALLDLPVPSGLPVLLAGSAVVAVVGFADDRWRLPALVRLMAYFAAASVLVLGFGYIDTLQWPNGLSLYIGWLGLPMTLFWLVGLTNVYNFMDGIDGIAGVQAVVVAATAALIAFARHEPGQGVYMLILAGGVAGFILHNWPPARVFMGDVGSAFLGYTFAGLAVLGNHDRSAIVPFSAWLILLAPFIFDAGLTLLRRIIRGERWYEAHREHLYQRLMRAGWSHQKVTLLYLGMAIYLALLVIAHFLLWIGNQVMVLAMVALPLLVLLLIVRHVEARVIAGGHRFARE